MHSFCPEPYMQDMGLWQDAHESYARNGIPANNCQLADDFLVPAGECWQVSGVKLMFIAPSIDSLNIAFYSDAGTVPGGQIAMIKHPTFTKVNRGTHLTQTAWEIRATLPTPVTLCGGGGGTEYWVSAQAIGSAACLWEVQSTTINGSPVAFRNPGGGISGCTSWTPMQSCLGATPTDAAFRLLMAESQQPLINGPSDTIINIPSGTGAVYTYNVTATDNCAVDTTYRISGLASGASHPIGITTNTWVAEDPSGNKDTCSFTVTVNLVIGVPEHAVDEISVYPNPTTGQMNVYLPAGCEGSHLQLFGIDGQMVADLGTATSSGKHEYDLSSLGHGMYFLRFEHPQFQIFRKIVKN
jgi:hypothetical protein